MIYGKEESKKLAQERAAVLVHESNTAAGTPIFVVRVVVGTFGYRSGKGDSRWGVTLDRCFSDGCDGVLLEYVLGVNTGSDLDITKLIEFLSKRYLYLPIEQREMLISDAYIRLKEVYK